MSLLIDVMNELNKKSVNDAVEVDSFKLLAKYYGVHVVYDEYTHQWGIYW